MVNYTVKRYFFEQSAVREFYSGAYYDLFLVMRGSGVFRCSEVVLPAQQQNLIIFKPGQGGRLEYAGAYGPLELIRVQLSPQTLAQLSDADTDLEKSFNVVPFRQVAVRPDSQIYMLLKKWFPQMENFSGQLKKYKVSTTDPPASSTDKNSRYL